MFKFGEQFAKAWPEENTIRLTEFGKKLLGECLNLEKPSFNDTTIADIINASSKFPIEFGINTCRIQNQPEIRHDLIRNQLASAYPVVHERVLHLYLQFLEHKCQYANKLEKDIFPKLSLTDFVHRLLTKRCVSFFGRHDTYLLLSREHGCSGFKTVGTEAEKPPLVLKDVLSYDEIKLSALLSVSSHTEFLNDGSRHNVGVIEIDKSKIEPAGVIVGLIGARLSRCGLMEFQDIVISKSQNTVANGYGPKSDDSATRQSSYRQVWNDFYEENDFVFDQVTKDGKRFGVSKNKDDIFDNLIMKKRYAISFDTLLLESEARAAAAGQRAFIHVVGIGLGVWKTAPQQEEIFLLTFTERLKALLPQLSHVGWVHFSWFHMTECGELKNGGLIKSETHPDGGIRTFLSNRCPADKLVKLSPFNKLKFLDRKHFPLYLTRFTKLFHKQQRPTHENTLLVVSYAWDGNALPGNEFWMEMLDCSGDPSTACSTLITEIHNPHINSQMVCGENLHVASAKYGVLHIAEYSRKVLGL